jgi:hypothetical protein
MVKTLNSEGRRGILPNQELKLASDASIAIDKAYVHIIYGVRCLCWSILELGCRVCA